MEKSGIHTLSKKIQQRWKTWQNEKLIDHLAHQVAIHAPSQSFHQPVVIFNSSARLGGLSQNAAFSLLTAWGLRLAGVPTIHFVCQSGMSHCVQGTNRQDYRASPPCQACIKLSQHLYQGSHTKWFTYEVDASLERMISPLSINKLSQFEYPLPIESPIRNSIVNPASIPLGALTLPSIRWALRCHHLPDDEQTRYLFRQYILSAYNVANEFTCLLEQKKPGAAIIFNGIMYPEAAACWVARKFNLQVITHEVGFQPFSAFFSHSEATAYPITIPDEFKLSASQNSRLDAYLEERFKGKFSMAGIQFWPQITRLDDAFLKHASQFKQIVPVFTNVIYDTSQVHANFIFEHMFEWLDVVLQMIHKHQDTLFVIRAHPDEKRPLSRKQSRESVHDWVIQKQVNKLSNVIFYDSQDYVSSYELIQKAKFLMIYNSSIGLEAALMGIPVLAAGKARYTQIPTVFQPQSINEYVQEAQRFLLEEHIHLPPVYQKNARHFLYYQLYRASLSFAPFLQVGSRPGYVNFRPFTWHQLLPENSNTLEIILNGVIQNQPFLMADQDAI